MRLLVLGLLGFMCCACFEPEEGCLDLSAANFNFDADRACTDCCTFPTLTFSSSNVWSTVDTTFNLRTDTTYQDGAGNAFLIDRIRFFASDLSLTNTDGDGIQLQDSLSFSYLRAGDTLVTTTEADYALLRVEGSSSSDLVGTIQPTGSVEAFTLRLGLDAIANSAIIDEVPSNAPFSSSNATLYFGENSGYAAVQIDLFLGTTAADENAFSITIFPEDLRQDLFTFRFTNPVVLAEGFDLTARIQVNYAAWFAGIDLSADSELVKNQIVDRLTESILFSTLESN